MTSRRKYRSKLRNIYLSSKIFPSLSRAANISGICGKVISFDAADAKFASAKKRLKFPRDINWARAFYVYIFICIFLEARGTRRAETTDIFPLRFFFFLRRRHTRILYTYTQACAGI